MRLNGEKPTLFYVRTVQGGLSTVGYVLYVQLGVKIGVRRAGSTIPGLPVAERSPRARFQARDNHLTLEEGT